MRERGDQSERGRADGRGLAPQPRGGRNGWQVLAIVALIAATAGWTTVAILATRSSSPAAVAPTASIDPGAAGAAGDASEPPIADAHDVPELEAQLPTALSGTALQSQSSSGGGILTDDAWSASMTSFLKAAGKTSADLQFAQAYDPTSALDGGFGVYRVVGLEAAAVRDALIAAWKGDYPEMKVSTVTLDGKKVTKGDFGADTPSTYWYVRGDLVFDIEAADEKLASAALAALPVPGAASPRTSSGPAASASAAPAP